MKVGDEVLVKATLVNLKKHEENISAARIKISGMEKSVLINSCAVVSNKSDIVPSGLSVEAVMEVISKYTFGKTTRDEIERDLRNLSAPQPDFSCDCGRPNCKSARPAPVESEVSRLDYLEQRLAKLESDSAMKTETIGICLKLIKTLSEAK